MRRATISAGLAAALLARAAMVPDEAFAGRIRNTGTKRIGEGKGTFFTPPNPILPPSPVVPPRPIKR